MPARVANRNLPLFLKTRPDANCSWAKSRRRKSGSMCQIHSRPRTFPAISKEACLICNNLLERASGEYLSVRKTKKCVPAAPIEFQNFFAPPIRHFQCEILKPPFENGSLPVEYLTKRWFVGRLRKCQHARK